METGERTDLTGAIAALAKQYCQCHAWHLAFVVDLRKQSDPIADFIERLNPQLAPLVQRLILMWHRRLSNFDQAANLLFACVSVLLFPRRLVEQYVRIFCHSRVGGKEASVQAKAQRLRDFWMERGLASRWTPTEVSQLSAKRMHRMLMEPSAWMKCSTWMAPNNPVRVSG